MTLRESSLIEWQLTRKNSVSFLCFFSSFLFLCIRLFFRLRKLVNHQSSFFVFLFLFRSIFIGTLFLYTKLTTTFFTLLNIVIFCRFFPLGFFFFLCFFVVVFLFFTFYGVALARSSRNTHTRVYVILCNDRRDHRR